MSGTFARHLFLIHLREDLVYHIRFQLPTLECGYRLRHE